MRIRSVVAVLIAALSAPLAAQPAPAVPAAAPDYTQDASWLCRPDRIDACGSDQSVTVIQADGQTRAEALVPDSDPKFDCFYVYPTVSNDPGGNSDMHADAEELRVAHAQAARFRQHCRVYAPIYRQVTLTTLRKMMAGGAAEADRAMALADVQAAWNAYLARDNGGRGVVLIGHSQGSYVLIQLLKAMSDPAQRAKIVSALLIGANVERGEGGTGDFAWMPACTSADQHGCLVSYMTFRAAMPPPANSRFGKATTPGMRAVCVNPAALLGHAGSAQAIFSTGGVGTSSRPMPAWVKGQPLPTTNFVTVPGLIAAECVSAGGFDYLAMTVKADPADPRADDVTGDVYAGDTRLADWGLHLIDMPVTMGDLVALTARQHASWAAAR